MNNDTSTKHKQRPTTIKQLHTKKRRDADKQSNNYQKQVNNYKHAQAITQVEQQVNSTINQTHAKEQSITFKQRTTIKQVQQQNTVKQVQTITQTIANN